MQRESAARVLRFVHLLARRVATGLAVVAALALLLDGALAGNHHLVAQAASTGHHHTHAHVHSHGHGQNDVHSHASAPVSGHQHITGDVAGSADVAAADQAPSPASGPDAGACCCSCTFCAAMVLPCLNAQAVPFVLLRTMATANRRQSDGVVPDGLRRPPRPLGIA